MTSPIDPLAPAPDPPRAAAPGPASPSGSATGTGLPPVIIEHVTRRFADVTAVADLSLEVAEGTMLGLIGPSRSGKTTTLRLLTGALAFVGLALFVLTALLLRRSMARA